MLAEATGAGARSDILTALKQASAATGSDFNYLLCTAMRESSLHPQAKSGTSSACGLFQFVEQTWFGLVKQFGAKHGLGSFAGAIAQSAEGHFSVDNASDRHAILALRNDPTISALMAGEYANVTRSSLETALGRDVSNGELYAAHFFGPEGASRLIRMNTSQPTVSAAAAFPQAAEANRTVFFRSDGTARSVREVYDWAVRQPGGNQGPSSPEVVVQTSAPRSAPQRTSVETTADSLAATQLWAALGPAPSTESLWPQAHLAATPDLLDILGALEAPVAAATRHSK